MDTKGMGLTNEKKTLIEEGTQLSGSVASTCPVVVRGRVQGDLSAPSLTVSPSGSVHGKVKVGHMVSEGEISGEFDADQIVLSGVVKNNTVVRAKSLEVKLAPAEGKMQVVFGECMLEVGAEAAPTAQVDETAKKEDEPAKKAAARRDSIPARVAATEVVADGSAIAAIDAKPRAKNSTPPATAEAKDSTE
jgi:cytoskeletal protein CcmA (bactofilin family)